MCIYDTSSQVKLENSTVRLEHLPGLEQRGIALELRVGFCSFLLFCVVISYYFFSSDWRTLILRRAPAGGLHYSHCQVKTRSRGMRRRNMSMRSRRSNHRHPRRLLLEDISLLTDQFQLHHGSPCTSVRSSRSAIS